MRALETSFVSRPVDEHTTQEKRESCHPTKLFPARPGRKHLNSARYCKIHGRKTTGCTNALWRSTDNRILILLCCRLCMRHVLMRSTNHPRVSCLNSPPSWVEAGGGMDCGVECSAICRRDVTTWYFLHQRAGQTATRITGDDGLSLYLIRTAQLHVASRPRDVLRPVG